MKRKMLDTQNFKYISSIKMIYKDVIIYKLVDMSIVHLVLTKNNDYGSVVNKNRK